MYFHIIDYVLTTPARPVVRVRRDGLHERCVMGGRSEGKLVKSLFKHTLLISILDAYTCVAFKDHPLTCEKRGAANLHWRLRSHE